MNLKKFNLIILLSIIVIFSSCSKKNIEQLEKNMHINIGQTGNTDIEFIGINSADYFIGYTFGLSQNYTQSFLLNKNIPEYEFYDICFKVKTDSQNDFYSNQFFNKITLSADKISYKPRVILETEKYLDVTNAGKQLEPNSEGYLHFVEAIPKTDINKDYKLSIKLDDKNSIEYMVNINNSKINETILQPNQIYKINDDYSIKFIKGYTTKNVTHSKRASETLRSLVTNGDTFAILEFELDSKTDKENDLTNLVKSTCLLPEMNLTEIRCEYYSDNNGGHFNGSIKQATKTKMYIYTKTTEAKAKNTVFKIIIDNQPYFYYLNK